MRGRDRRFVTSLLRDRFMPVVVTARNTPVTYNNAGRSNVSVQGDRDVLRWLRKVKETRDLFYFRNWVLVLAALSLALTTIEWIFVWCITLLNDQHYWSKILNTIAAFVWNTQT